MQRLMYLTVATVALLFGTACAGQIETGLVIHGYPAYYVETVPADVYVHPRVVYRGRYAYLVDDRWYYRSSRGWVAFREEPPVLRRYRVRYYRDVPVYRRHYLDGDRVERRRYYRDRAPREYRRERRYDRRERRYDDRERRRVEPRPRRRERRY